MEEALLETMTLEPPRTLVEREQAFEVVQQAWPWQLTRFQDDIRTIASQHVPRRSELEALTTVIAHLQQETFGGEDPLDPEMRALLDDTWQGAQAFAEALGAMADWVRIPCRDENPGWPPSLDDADTVTQRQRELEQHLVGSKSV